MSGSSCAASQRLALRVSSVSLEEALEDTEAELQPRNSGGNEAGEGGIRKRIFTWPGEVRKAKQKLTKP